MHEDLWRVTSVCVHISLGHQQLLVLELQNSFFFPYWINCRGQRAEFVIVMQKKLEYNPTARCRERKKKSVPQCARFDVVATNLPSDRRFMAAINEF